MTFLHNSIPSKLWMTPHLQSILIFSWIWTTITMSLNHPKAYFKGLVMIVQIQLQPPQGLLPSHGRHDHGIPPSLRSQPPNVHPYRHPFAQKNEIERVVHVLLESRVIHPITSPYSSLIVMVLKKEYTWHMCPNFHTLNKLIKDKFPILVIDNLLGELHDAPFFNKIYLHFGYHQIWMKDVDSHKTAFFSYEVHYEFLLISFGLFNSPSTFQCS